jgi:hypothetical protein
VWLKRKRSAATVLFMAGAFMSLLGPPDLELPDVLGRRRAGRAFQEGSKARDGAQIILAGFLCEPAHGHVGDEALTQAAGCRQKEIGHGKLLGMGELPAPARAWARSIHMRLSTWQRVSANRTTPAIAGSFCGHIQPRRLCAQPNS